GSAANNGTDSGSSSSAGNGSNSGSSSAGNSGNSNGSANNGTDSGSSSSAGSSAGGFFGHLFHSISTAAQKIGNSMVHGGSVTVPLFSSGGESNNAVGESTPRYTFGSPEVKYSGWTGTLPDGSKVIIDIAPGHPGNDPLTGWNHSTTGWFALQQMKRTVHGEGKAPYKVTLSGNPSRKVLYTQAPAGSTSGGEAFCMQGGASHFATIQFQPLYCRLRQNGSLSVYSTGTNRLSFTVPQGDFETAFTNNYGSRPNYYLAESTADLERTRGYAFPASMLRRVASITRVSHWLQTFGSCVAGPVVHYRDGVPMIWQRPSEEPTHNVSLGLTGVPSNQDQINETVGNPTLQQELGVNGQCLSYLDYPQSTLHSIFPYGSTYGYPLRYHLWIKQHGTWQESPTYGRAYWIGPASLYQTNARKDVLSALRNLPINGKTFSQWGFVDTTP
ncbi:hypothetical protein, partial [Acidithiobacillus sp.]|uniref:hypothetical protein n=1 Tax=Acidithiobacillus sp. TaxID=1872118 RepID=UPI003D03385C